MSINNQADINYLKSPLSGKNGQVAFETKLPSILESHEGAINTLIEQTADELRVKIFDTMAQAQADTSLVAGDVIEVLGYYEKGDGGGFKGKKNPLGSTYEFEILDGKINVKFCGATGNGIDDDTVYIQEAINRIGLSGGSVFIPKGNFKYTNLVFPKQSIARSITFEGEGNLISQLHCYGTGGTSVLAEGTNSDRIWINFKNIYFYNIGDNANIDGISINYMFPYAKFENVRIRNFKNNIIVKETYGIDFDNLISTLAKEKCFKCDYAFNQTGLKFFGGQISNGNIQNIDLTGYNHYIAGTILEAGINNFYNCHGLTLDSPYYEGSTENLGFYFNGCKAVSVNGINVSNWLDGVNTTLIKIENTNAFVMNGFECSRGTGALKNGLAIHVKDSNSIILNSNNIEKISNGFKIENSNGEINGAIFSSVTKNFDIADSEFVRFKITTNRSNFDNSTIGANARLTIFDWKSSEFMKIGGQNTMIQNLNLDSFPTASIIYRNCIINIKGTAGNSDSPYICAKKDDETYEWIRIPRMFAGTNFSLTTTINANSNYNFDIVAIGVKVGDMPLISFSAWNQNLIYSAQIITDGNIKVTIFNPTGSNINLSGVTVRNRTIKVF